LNFFKIVKSRINTQGKGAAADEEQKPLQYTRGAVADGINEVSQE